MPSIFSGAFFIFVYEIYRYSGYIIYVKNKLYKL